MTYTCFISSSLLVVFVPWMTFRPVIAIPVFYFLMCHKTDVLRPHMLLCPVNGLSVVNTITQHGLKHNRVKIVATKSKKIILKAS